MIEYRLIKYRMIKYRLAKYRMIKYRMIKYRLIKYRMIKYRMIKYRMILKLISPGRWRLEASRDKGTFNEVNISSYEYISNRNLTKKLNT